MKQPQKQKQNIEKWLEDNNYHLPDNPSDYPDEVVIPFYQAPQWKTKAGYIAVGPVIIHPYPNPNFGVFWQKLILPQKKITNLLSPRTDSLKTKAQAEVLIDMIQKNLGKAYSYVSLSIQACYQEEPYTFYDLAEVLQDAKKFLNNLSELNDDVVEIIHQHFKPKERGKK